MQRFLDRAWRLVMETVEAGDAAPEPTTAQLRQRHKTVKKVTEEVENLRMNTAIAAVIEWTNEMIAAGTAPVPHARTLVLLLAPFAPHLAEELFSRLCPQEHAQAGSVARIAWPDFDPALAVDDEIEIVVQVNGKRRGSFLAATDESGESLSARAAELDTVARHLEGKTLARTILAPPQRPRIVNFVVR
jgi:leucyl-tRNA synthetase